MSKAPVPQSMTLPSAFIKQVNKMQCWFPFVTALVIAVSYVQAADCK